MTERREPSHRPKPMPQDRRICHQCGLPIVEIKPYVYRHREEKQ